MAEKMAVYTYDKDMIFTGSLLVDDDYELIDGETGVKPEDGLYEPIKFDGTKWDGTDKEVYDAEQEKLHQAYLAEHPVPPDASDTAIAQLTLQIATNKAEQDKLNARLLLASATTQSTESGNK